MAFYVSEPNPYQPQPYGMPYGSQTNTRSYPFSGRWQPGMPLSTNVAARSTQAASANRRGGGGYYGRPGSAPTSIIPYLPGAGMPRMETPPRGPAPGVSRSNPYAVPWDRMATMNQGKMLADYEGRRYLGGFPDDYASGARVSVPYTSDNLSMRYFAYQKRPPAQTVYGRPVYREGDQARFAYNLSPDDIMGWQDFFRINGFKTGVAGLWGPHEMAAMKAFMTAANGVPGGGMRVEVLRARVDADIAAGRITPGTLAEDLDASGSAGAAAGESLEPYTETTVEKQQVEYSLDQGLQLLRSDLAQQVGRLPSEAEVAAYIKALNAAARADPTVITSVVTTNPMTGESNSTRTVEQSAVDPQAMALTFARTGTPPAEREGYQADRYITALMNELGL